MELQSNQVNELMPEFIQAVSELGNLSKDKAGYGYKYVELSTVLDAARPVLNQHNLVITQLVTIVNEEPTLVTTLYHKSGQFLRSFYPLVKAGVQKANDAQQVGAAITYARRYALTAMLFIAQEDDDAASLGQQKQQQQQQQKKPPASKSIIEQLKERLQSTGREDLDSTYDRHVEWLKEKHPDLIEAYNRMFSDHLANLE